MGDRLKGKVAIVTGAGRGLGRSHALALAAEGAKIVVNDLGVASDGSGTDASPAEQVANEIKKAGGDAIASFGNVTKLEDCQKTVQEAVDKWGRVDILINNAGVLRDRMVFNMSAEEWDIVIKTHLYGHFNCIRAVASQMRQQRGGRIVNTSSESGLGNLGQVNYSAAKEGIIGLTRTVARDLGRYGIICNAIRPRAGTRMTLNDAVQEAWVAQLEGRNAARGVNTFTQRLRRERQTNAHRRRLTHVVEGLMSFRVIRDYRAKPCLRLRTCAPSQHRVNGE